MGEIKDAPKKKQNGQIVRGNKKPEKNFFKKKKVKAPANRKKCIERARGRCQNCGSIDQISAHHIIFKGERGDDAFQNLIALCFSCHRKAHDGYYISKKYITPKDFIIEALERIDLQFYRDTIEERKRK